MMKRIWKRGSKKTARWESGLVATAEATGRTLGRAVAALTSAERVVARTTVQVADAKQAIVKQGLAAKKAIIKQGRAARKVARKRVRSLI